MQDDTFTGVTPQTVGRSMWRIENKIPCKFDAFTNKLHEGDCYLVLDSVKSATSTSVEHKIHFWLGNECSVDEKGIVAYKAVELDDKLNGLARQIRETQGNESDEFLAYFKSYGGIEYLPGGVESGFKHVEKDVYPTRLLHVKGKRVCRVKSVEVSSSSLNKGDAFVLDKGLMIYVFFGSDCNKYEQIKAMEIVRQINDDERGARGQVIRLEDDPENEDFWSTLGGYVDPSSLPMGPSDDTVAAFPPNKLFKISDAAGGSPTTEEIEVPGGKLMKDMLDSNDNFIVVSQGKVFIWIGKGSTTAEKREAMPAAMNFAASNPDVDANCRIERVAEGVEPAAFRSVFAKWSDPKSVKTWKSETAGKLEQLPIDVAELLANQAKQDEPLEADPGSEKIQIFTIENFEPKAIESAMHGQFFAGDSYIIVYECEVKRRKQAFIFFWLGSTSTTDEKGACALQTKKMDDDMFGGSATQVRVVQGKEPSQLRSLFQGKMIIHTGGLASGFKNKNDVSSKDEDGVALFHVRGTTELNTCGIQVEEKASELNGEDCFVLVTPASVFVWKGNAATSDEEAVASNIADILANTYLGTGGREIVHVTEGSESDAFWEPLGGKADYPAFAPGSEPPRNPRLFQCANNIGIDVVEEIVDFTQEDLNDDDTFILDTWTTLYVWMGNTSDQNEKDLAMDMANRFLSKTDRSDDTPIIRCNAGQEPIHFTSLFVGWDTEYFTKNTFVDPYAAKMAQLKAAMAAKRGEEEGLEDTKTAAAPAPAPVASAGGFFDLTSLRAGCPAGVNPSRKEDALSDSDFQTVFKMDRASFEGLAAWKRNQKKKDAGIF